MPLHKPFLCALLLASLAACGNHAGDNAAKPPPEVGFVVMRPTSVPLVAELPGRTAAFRIAEVRPQVSGVIQQRLFTEGALVRAGQPLYRIDPSLYRAAAAQAEANLASAEANAGAAQARAERYKPLAADNAVSQQDYTDAAAAARQSTAAVAQSRAALNTARINLRFTTVPAPVSGRIGRSLVTEGALATSGQASPLSVISVLDPIYVDIQQNAGEVLALRRAGNGRLADHVDVRLLLEDGHEYPLPGRLEFSEVTVDPATGTVTLRARFPNPQGLLLPGLFVRTRLSRGLQDHVWLVPQVALTRDPRGTASVLVVGPGNKAVARVVTAERTWNDAWVVTAGLQDGDRVITQGLGKIAPGKPINPVPAASAERVRPGSDPGRAR
jgi:membrane fusion protein (multidrug efflux system)